MDKATILILLVLAHILTDFVIQKKEWVEAKNEQGLKSKYFWIHVLLSGILTYVLVQQWTNWQVPLFIIVTHGFIDLWKIRQEKQVKQFNNPKTDKSKYRTGTNYFLFDQFLHLVVILIAWLILIKGFNQVVPVIKSTLSDKQFLAIVTALVVLVWPIGISIGKITEPFRRELDTSDSLSKAGLYIGSFERILVFIFIMIGQYAAIGFLIASKSILRITRDSDKDGRKKTEYVLIGTLISFTLAILVGLLVQNTLKS